MGSWSRASALGFSIAIVAAIVLPVIVGSTASAADPTFYDEAFVNYFTNAHVPGVGGSSNIYITDPIEKTATTTEEICAMIYVFDEREGMQECCGCPVTSDGLLVLNITSELTANPRSLTGESIFYDGVIRLLSTGSNASTTPTGAPDDTSFGYLRSGVGCDAGSGVCCDPSGGTAFPSISKISNLSLTPTLRAWGDHAQNAYLTNTAFSEVPIAQSDAGNLALLCGTALNQGTFNGFCYCSPQGLTPTPTPTTTPTASAAATATATPAPTASAAATASATPTPTASAAATATATPAPTASVAATATDTPAPTASAGASATDTPTPTASATATATDTPAATPTATATDVAAAALCPVPGSTPVSSPGSSGNYTVLAGASVTNTDTLLDPTMITGNLGISPGSTLTGAPGVSGFTDLGNGNSLNGQNILTGAYNYAAGLGSASIPAELGGTSPDPGVYSTPSGAFLISAGDLTLDAKGDPNAVWIFQMGSTLTTVTPTIGTNNVVLAGDANGCNVFWQVGSSATLGVGTIFYGNIMANQSITLTTDVSIPMGRALAQNASVTLDSNKIGGCTCPP